MKKILSIVTACSFMLGSYLTINALESDDINKNNTGVLSAAINASTSDYANQVAALVNKERAANGLNPVKMSPQLSQAADVRAVEIKQNFSHTRPDGTSCFTAITDMGITYQSVAENIAYGQKNPEAVMDAWMNSSGHRANILNKNMEYIGVGVNYENGVYYWTQFFAVSSQLSDDSYLPEENKPPVVTTVTSATTYQTSAPQTTVPETQTTQVTTDSTTKPEVTSVTTTAQSTTSAVTKTEPSVTTAVPEYTTTAPQSSVTTVPAVTTPDGCVTTCTSVSFPCNTQKPCTSTPNGCLGDQLQNIFPGCNDNINQIIGNIIQSGNCNGRTSCNDNAGC